MSQIKFRKIESDDQDQRLDRWLKRSFPVLNQIKIEKLCRKGEIRLNKGRVKPSRRLALGDIVRIPPIQNDKVVLSKPSILFSEYDIKIIKRAVIYQDDHLLVINKPPGLASQGGSSQKDRHVDSLSGVFKKKGNTEKPKLVHILDKDTSGILILAKNRKTAEFMTKSFKLKTVEKIYWALVAGVPKEDIGTIRFSLAKKKLSNGVEKVVPILPHEEKNYLDAKRSITDYVVIEKVSQRTSWLGLSPITGRTHQLRAHLAAIGCPIIGDTKYGIRKQTNNGEGWGAHIGGIISRKLHLHARSITFEHPMTGELMFLEADLPSHMANAWDTFNWDLKWAPKNPFKIYE